MAGTKLGITVQQARQQLDLRFKNDADAVIGEVTLGRDAVEAFLGQLVAAREMLRPGAAPAMGTGAPVRLPPPMEYYTMMAGTDIKSGLPVLGFKVGPEMWLSFRIEAEGIPGLAKLFAEQASARKPGQA